MIGDHITNIGASGARRRALGGYVWLAIAAAVFIVLVATHAPRAFRLGLAVPLFLASTGIFQARAKT